jgi:MFS family permease
MDVLERQPAPTRLSQRLKISFVQSSHVFDRQFWNFLIASLFFDLGMFIFSFLYNLYLLDRGLNERSMGWIAGALSLGTMFATIPAGALTRKIGLRNALLCCFVILPVVSAARALAQGIALLVALSFVGGAGFAIWAVSLPPVVARLTNERNRSLGFSLIFALGIGSGILGGYLGGHMPSWLSAVQQAAPAGLKQSSLLFSCAFVLFGVVPCLRLRIQSEERSQVRTGKLDLTYLWRFLPAVAVWSFGLGVLSPFLSVYMTKCLRLALPQVGSMFSLSQFLQMVSVLLAPRVFRKFGTLAGVTLSQVATSLALIAFVGFSSRIWTLSAFAAMSLFQYMNEPGLYTLLMNNVAPEDQSRASAWNFFVICGAQAIAAVSGGALLVHLGYSVVLFSVAVLMAISAAVLFYSVRRKKVVAIPQAASSNPNFAS